MINTSVFVTMTGLLAWLFVLRLKQRDVAAAPAMVKFPPKVYEE
jgi:hypothetical protein